MRRRAASAFGVSTGTRNGASSASGRRATVEAGGEPPALPGRGFEPVEFPQGHACAFGDQLPEGERPVIAPSR
jgi:hypothetical protein